MRQARRKRGRGKNLKKVKRRCLNERETLSYEQEILENNRQLARLRSRNEELEEETKLAKKRLQQLEEDRSDVIAHVKRNLEEKVCESRELSERLAALEELRKEELVAYNKKEEAMRHEYHTMESTLSAELKLAAGKLNALEDWRVSRVELMTKYEKQEVEMAEQAERHKTALYEAEKAMVIGKALMQKEMDEKLQTLSKELRKSTTLRMADIMHRAIRENVALNHELDDMLKINKKLESVNSVRKKTEQTLRLKSQLLEAESKITSKQVWKQRDIIHQMAKDFEELLVRYTQAERFNVQFSKLQQILDNIIEQTNQKQDKQIQTLKIHISMAMNENEKLATEVQNKEKQLKALRGILNLVKQLLDEASLITKDAISKQQCTDCIVKQLLQSLNEILQAENLIEVIECTPSEVENIDCKYTPGCLGLIEPLEPCENCMTNKSDNDVQDVEEKISLEKFEERVPSCLLSVISSSILSPKESEIVNSNESNKSK